MALGVARIVGGLLSFLPVLGVWMLPLGILVVANAHRVFRGIRRRSLVRVRRAVARWRWVSATPIW